MLTPLRRDVNTKQNCVGTVCPSAARGPVAALADSPHAFIMFSCFHSSFFWPVKAACVSLVDMGDSAIDTALDGLLEPLTRCLDAESARRVAELRIDPAVQSRVDVLAERANNGVLSEEERAEYEAFINAADLVSILKLKARRHLDLNQG